MSESHKPFSSYARVLLAGALVFAFACSTDSPTEPRQDPQPPGGQPSGAFTISLSASASQLPLGTNEAITLTINVRQTSNNQAPPDGTTVVVRTTLGNLGSAGSGIQEGTVELISGVAQLLLFAGDSEGTATISAQIENAIARANVTFTGSATFFLQAVSPTIGSPNGGDVVRITGGGFLEPVRVTFGSIPAEVLSVGPTSIRVRTPTIDLPVGGSQRVSVNVIVGLNTDQQQSDSLANAFTYTRGGTATDPVIFSVTPNAGPNEGGTRVVIEGDGFDSPVQVLFGSGSIGSFSGIEAVVESVTSTRIVVLSPTATGFGQGNRNSLVGILVRNRNSGSAALFTNAFRYGVDVLITSIGPGEGPFTGGQLVTLFGQGFDEPVAVSLAGVAQSIISVTGTEIIVRTSAIEPNGCTDVSGPSSVTNIETGDSANGPIYVYRVVQSTPRALGLNPNSGVGGGNATTTITGDNFTSGTEILFLIGGEELRGTIQSVTPSSLVVAIPRPPNTAFDTETCDDNGDGFAGERYISTIADVQVSDILTTCTSTFEGSFTFNPTDTSCRNDIGPADPVEPPTAAFSFATLNDPREIQFIDGSSGPIFSWSWNFGDLGTSSSQNPVHTYAMDGTYTVSLTVTGEGGSDTAVQVITIPIP